MNNIDVKASYTSADSVPLKMITDPDVIAATKDGRIPPIHVQLSITNKCNMSCDFCSMSKRDRKQELSYDECIFVLDKCSSLGTKAITHSIHKDELVIYNDKNGLYCADKITKLEDNFNDKIGISEEDSRIVFNPIVDFIKHPCDGELVHLTLSNGKNIKVTTNHSVYCYNHVLRKIELKEAGLLTIDDSVVYCIPKINKISCYSFDTSSFCMTTSRGVKNPGTFVITKDFCRLLGFYVSEGCSVKDDYNVNFTFDRYENEAKYIDDLCNIADSLGFKNNTYVRKYHNKTSVVIFSKWFVQLIKSIGVGILARNKRIPNIIFNLDKEFVVEFLKGLFAGDGTFRDTVYKTKYRRNNLNIKTSSRILHNTLSLLFDLNDIRHTTVECKTPERKIDGRKLKASTYYMTSVSSRDSLMELKDVIEYMGKEIIYKSDIKNGGYALSDNSVSISESIFASRIKKIELIQDYYEDVFDIEIENSHKFLSSFGILVHNTGGGEFLMHKNAGNVFKYAKDLGILNGLVTNGLLLSEEQNLETLTWCRISNGDERTFGGKYAARLQNLVNKYCNVDWAFSHVCSAAPNMDEISRVVEFANMHNFTHVRLVSDLFHPDDIDLASIKGHLLNNGIDDSRIIYQGRKNPEPGGPCHICYLKPFIAADGNIYTCCACQYALEIPSYDFPKELCLGNVFDAEKIWANSGAPFDGSICKKCYYMNYNRILGSMLKELNHKEFV